MPHRSAMVCVPFPRSSIFCSPVFWTSSSLAPSFSPNILSSTLTFALPCLRVSSTSSTASSVFLNGGFVNNNESAWMFFCARVFVIIAPSAGELVAGAIRAFQTLQRPWRRPSSLNFWKPFSRPKVRPSMRPAFSPSARPRACPSA